MGKLTLFWFRRDLRLEDNAGLWKALKNGYPVVPIFIFDANILDQLEDKKDARVSFLHQRILKLNGQLKAYNTCLKVFYGNPLDAFSMLINEYSVQSVFYNRDYEPYAIKRDKAIFDLLSNNSIAVVGAKDHVIFEKNETVDKIMGKGWLITTLNTRGQAEIDSNRASHEIDRASVEKEQVDILVVTIYCYPAQ